jgi:hypothetical protein
LDNFEISEVRVYDEKYFTILKKLLKHKKKVTKIVLKKKSLNLGIFRLCKNTILNITYIILSLLCKSKYRKNVFYNSKNIILFSTRVINDQLRKDTFQERYYPGLEKYSKKKKIFFFPILLFRLNIIKFVKIIDKKQNIICEFDVLNLYDYLECFFKSFLIYKYKFKKIYFKDYEVTELVNNQLNNDFYSQSLFQNLIIYNFIKKIRSNLNIETFVDWFENQQINRAFNIAVNNYFPKVKSIGYQGFIVSENFYYFHSPTLLKRN